MPVDVLGLGAVAVDDLLYVDAYPAPDDKVSVARKERHCGGLTATALVAACRYGATCRYAGLLGTDDLSDFAAGRMAAEGVDLAFTRREPDGATIHSVIIVGSRDATRTILGYLPGNSGAAAGWPPEAVVRDSRVLFVDPFGVPGMIRAAHIAREAGVPVVADIEGGSRSEITELLALVDHLVIPAHFAVALSGCADPAGACCALWHGGVAAVVVTAGVRGAWFTEGEGQVSHQPAFPVQVVDTTGCGDVFHGVYAAALAEGLLLPERVLRASAAASMKATQPGGQPGIPRREALERFLKERSQ